MMIKCVIMFATLQIVSLSLISLPVSRDFHFMSCLRTVLRKHVPQGTNLVVSFPAYTNDTMLTSFRTDTLQVVDAVLQNINKETRWQLHVHQLDTKHPDGWPLNLPYKPDIYIILLGPEKESDKLVKFLVSQLNVLSSPIPFSPSARFIFIVTGYCANIAQFLRWVIVNIWVNFKIANLIIMIPRPDSDRRGINEDMNGLVETKSIDIYSWFPYEGNSCADNFSAVLMDQCRSETFDTFLHNVSLYPNKIPRKFAGCPCSAFVAVVSPYVMLTDNYTDSAGRTVGMFSGIDVEFINLVAEALNLTLNYSLCGAQCGDRERPLPIEVIAGFRPLNSIALELRDVTIPYAFDALTWFVPCPKSAMKMERILSVFNASVWITMLPVFVLTALVFWSSAKRSLGTVIKESYGYRTLLHCLYNVWCVFLSVSVPEMPRTFKVRALFCLFVWYSFAMSTIFQSFFISFLVSPGYLPRISSFDDLNRSGLKYGSLDGMDKFLRDAEYVEHDRLNLDRVECPDEEKCLERVFTEGDIIFVAPKFLGQYIASRVSRTLEQNNMCFLDETVFSSNCVLLLPKGHPVLDRFNVVIRHSLEAGLGDKYWSDLTFNLTLQNMRKPEASDCQACSNMYFVFSLTHLKVVFLVLGFGHILGVTTFVAELICKWFSKGRTAIVKS